MVVALHQGGVRVGRSTHSYLFGELGTQGCATSFRGILDKRRTIAVGCDRGDGVG